MIFATNLSYSQLLFKKLYTVSILILWFFLHYKHENYTPLLVEKTIFCSAEAEVLHTYFDLLDIYLDKLYICNRIE